MEQSHTTHDTKTFLKDYRTGTNKQVMLSGSIDNNKQQTATMRCAIDALLFSRSIQQ